MKALIQPIYYFSKDIFKQENTKIFSKCWHYVGMIDDFVKLNDYVTIIISEIPIVVQNVKGEIKAFKNICSHRHSIIQVDSYGNRPLICPYHGWAYNENGLPKGIPRKPYFDFSEDYLECLRLKEYKVEFCGKLVFVNLDEDPISLNEFLGQEFFLEMRSLSNAIGPKVDHNHMIIQANWKILVENTLESYHVNLIHADSFLRLGANGNDFSYCGSHSYWDANLKFKENEGKQEKIHRPFQNRACVIDGYRHIFIFPNLLISTTYGISFNISLIQPINELESSFKSFVFLTEKNSNSKSNPAIENLYKDSLVEFNRQVFNEDKEICEKVQIGAMHSHFNGELSDEEARVCHFQFVYKEFGIINSQENE